jgi:poly(hydroxyalkanoate) depolymerase family esterase
VFVARRLRRSRFTLLAALYLLFFFAMPTAHGQSPGTFLDGRFESEYGSRRYKLWIPAAADEGGRAKPPLVVMLHGCTQDADDIARGTRLNERAGSRHWLVLYPEQPESANGKKCWNWYDRAHQARGAGEPALLAALIAQVTRRHGADGGQVYLAGISAGGAMAISLAVAYPELFVAVAVHSAIPYRAAAGVLDALAVMRDGAGRIEDLPLAGRAPVPLLVIHGEQDGVVNPRNGAQLAEQWRAAGERVLGSPPARLEEEGRSADGRPWRRVSFRASPTNSLVEWWTVRELGHAWSGGSAAGTFTDERGPDATALMLDFFARRGSTDARTPEAR